MAALRASLIAGEQSGEAEDFDVDAFLDAKRATSEPCRRITTRAVQPDAPGQDGSTEG